MKNKIKQLMRILRRRDARGASGLRYYGMAYLSVWLSWVNLNGHDVFAEAPLFSTGGTMTLFLILMIVLFLRKPDSRVYPSIDIFAALALSLATVVFAVPGSSVARAIGTFLAGAGMAWLYMSWGQFYSQVRLKDAIAFIFVSYALSSAIKLGLLVLPAPLTSVIVFTFPLISAFSLRKSRRTKKLLAKNRVDESERDEISSRVTAFSGCIAFFAIALTLVRMLLPSDKAIPLMAICHTGEIVLALVVLASVLLRKTPTRIISLWSVLLFFVSTALLLVSVNQFPASTLFADLGTSYLVMLSWAVFADFAHHSSLHPFVIFGIGRVSYSLPIYVVSVLRSFFGFELAAPVLVVVLFWVLSMVTTCFFGSRMLSGMTFFGDLSNESSSAPSVTDVEGRCSDLAVDYGLTGRETEIMALLCLGKSKAYIAEQLFLSESTIKTHTRNLYLKLGVHNKNDLQRLIDL